LAAAKEIFNMTRKNENEVIEVLSSELRDEIRRASADTLSAAIEAAGALVAPHLADSGRQVPLNGKTHYMAAKASAAAQRAAGFLTFVDSFQEFVKDATTDDLKDSAFFLGMSAAEMLGSYIAGKPTSKVLDAYSRISEGGTAGTKVTNAAHDEIRPKYQSAVDQFMATGLKYTPACQKVASEMGVTSRTVARHTKNPAPQNKGRRR
jgi:hypothetical protein